MALVPEPGHEARAGPGLAAVVADCGLVAQNSASRWAMATPVGSAVRLYASRVAWSRKCVLKLGSCSARR